MARKSRSPTSKAKPFIVRMSAAMTLSKSNVLKCICRYKNIIRSILIAWYTVPKEIRVFGNSTTTLSRERHTTHDKIQETQHANNDIHHKTRNTPRTTTTYSTRHTTYIVCDSRDTACEQRHTSYNPQHTAYDHDIQHTTHHIYSM